MLAATQLAQAQIAVEREAVEVSIVELQEKHKKELEPFLEKLRGLQEKCYHYSKTFDDGLFPHWKCPDCGWRENVDC